MTRNVGIQAELNVYSIEENKNEYRRKWEEAVDRMEERRIHKLQDLYIYNMISVITN